MNHYYQCVEQQLTQFMFQSVFVRLVNFHKTFQSDTQWQLPEKKRTTEELADKYTKWTVREEWK